MKAQLLTIATFSSIALIGFLILFKYSQLRLFQNILISSAIGGLFSLLLITFITKTSPSVMPFLIANNTISLQIFPSDAATEEHKYTGIDQDGWIDETSFTILTDEITPQFLVIKGLLPLISDPFYSSTINISIDGKEHAQQNIHVGNFEMKVQLPSQVLKGPHRIDIAFSDAQQLPQNDGRVTAGKLELIGFQNN